MLGDDAPSLDLAGAHGGLLVMQHDLVLHMHRRPASVAILPKVSLTKLLRIDIGERGHDKELGVNCSPIARLETPVSGWTCFRTRCRATERRHEQLKPALCQPADVNVVLDFW